MEKQILIGIYKPLFIMNKGIFWGKKSSESVLSVKLSGKLLKVYFTWMSKVMKFNLNFACLLNIRQILLKMINFDDLVTIEFGRN